MRLEKLWKKSALCATLSLILSCLGRGPANPGLLCPHPLGPRVLRRQADPEHDANGAAEADNGELWSQLQTGS